MSEENGKKQVPMDAEEPAVTQQPVVDEPMNAEIVENPDNNNIAKIVENALKTDIIDTETGESSESDDSGSEEEETTDSEEDSSDSDEEEKEGKPKIPNKKCLKENLKILKSTLSATASKTESYKNLHSEPQLALDLNQLAMVNIVDWIQQKLRGEDPSITPLKNLLERIKETMLVFEQVKDGGRRPATVKRIETLFQYVYDL